MRRRDPHVASHRAPSGFVPRGALPFVAGLAIVSGAAWLLVVRDAGMANHGGMGGGERMTMPDGSIMMMPSADGPTTATLTAGARYVAMWGIMMVAMMLPSATPMLLLYRTVRTTLAAAGEEAVPTWMFGAVYVLLWTLSGVPLYLATTVITARVTESPPLGAVVPYVAAALLTVAGLYQLSPLKWACLRRCNSPLDFLMHRWRSGYVATLRLGAEHAAWCLGCCWGLMVLLVATGAMSLPWVVALTLVVLAEKVLPNPRRTARIVGALLLGLAVAVVVRPTLATVLRF